VSNLERPSSATRLPPTEPNRLELAVGGLSALGDLGVKPNIRALMVLRPLPTLRRPQSSCAVLLGAGSERRSALQPIETIDHRWVRFVLPIHTMVRLAA
jgi:hypothetical protein